METITAIRAENNNYKKSMWMKSTKIMSHGRLKPFSSWAVSLAELEFRVLQRDQPRVLMPGTAVISSRDPWR